MTPEQKAKAYAERTYMYGIKQTGRKIKEYGKILLALPH